MEKIQESLNKDLEEFKVRRGSHDEILLFQGKEQGLRFAGAAMRRHPTFKVREMVGVVRGHQRTATLKP